MPDADLADMVVKMRQIPAVDDVETYQAWTGRLTRLARGGVAAAGVLAIVVLSAVLAVIGSTMRLVLQRRRTEVEVLKLVGATDGFVKKPFVLEGAVQGAIGALAALALLGLLFVLVRGRADTELAGLVGVEPSFLPWPVAIGMVFLGGVLGALAALVSLRRLVPVCGSHRIGSSRPWRSRRRRLPRTQVGPRSIARPTRPSHSQLSIAVSPISMAKSMGLVQSCLGWTDGSPARTSASWHTAVRIIGSPAPDCFRSVGDSTHWSRTPCTSSAPGGW